MVVGEVLECPFYLIKRYRQCIKSYPSVGAKAGEWYLFSGHIERRMSGNRYLFWDDDYKNSFVLTEKEFSEHFSDDVLMQEKPN